MSEGLPSKRKRFGCKDPAKGWRGAHVHAVKRLDERFGLKLTREQWAAIVDNARAGIYERSKARRRPARAHERRRTLTKPSPVFAVPLRCEVEGWVLWTSMAINVTQGLVISVLPEHRVEILENHGSDL